MNTIIIPAEPGWRLLFDVDGKGTLAPFETIIAWAIKTETDSEGGTHQSTKPVVSNGYPIYDGFLAPDGHVEANEQVFADLADFKQQFTAKRGAGARSQNR